MKKKLSILIALVMAISLCLSPVMVSAASMPEIDGVISGDEWGEAVTIRVAGGMGRVKVIASRSHLYVLFRLKDSTDARLGQNLKGNDQISINVNPTAGVGTWGFPYDLIFETSADFPWNPKDNSGIIDGWNTRWFPNNAQEPLPASLESATRYTRRGIRITEWKLPLASIASSLGSSIQVGGAIEVGDGNSYVYPVGLDWNDPDTFITIEIPPAPTRSTLTVVMPFGRDSTSYISDSNVLRDNIEVVGIYDDVGYKLVIPEGCVVERPSGERIYSLYLKDINGSELTFTTNDVNFSEPCVLYTTEGELTLNMWGRVVSDGEWVEVGSFTEIVDREATLN